MARGAQSPAPAPLPKVSFQKVDVDGKREHTGFNDRQLQTFGYNDGADYEQPEAYIRYIEPLESELDRQIEYDMDEQDEEWLKIMNEERVKEQVGKVMPEHFEIIMDRLEKEWFNLTKNITQPDMALPSEDSTCAICDDSEGENMNAIVFCDGCNLAVHQDCYGVPYIPEGQWLCRKCTVSPETAVECVLCPNEGGAFKQTTTGEWVHLLCALWIRETQVVNPVFMEPITGVDQIPKNRWKLRCSICDVRQGACIQCAKSTCYTSFHVTCARNDKLLMPMKSNNGGEASLECYCEKHLPSEQLKVREAALAEREAEATDDDNDGAGPNGASGRSAKSARAYAKTYKIGPPLVPALIVGRIEQYIAKIQLRKKHEFVVTVCKYWSLKREARRGAPLLKRLHLEPWTASGRGNSQNDEERAMRLEHMKRLLNNLNEVKKLLELVHSREKTKQEQAEVLASVLSQLLYPHAQTMREAFEKVINHDKSQYFEAPVSRAEVPDYFDVIRKPMCWSMIRDKLDQHQYWSVKALQDDIVLVLDNAMLYNKSDTSFYKLAWRIKNNHLPSIFTEMEKRIHSFPSVATNTAVETSSPSQTSESEAGTLEPSLEILNLLSEKAAIEDATDLILSDEPVTSLFQQKHARFRPPPPPPPPPPKKEKPKRDYAQERARANALRTARAEQAMLDLSAGFRAQRSTRRGAVSANEDQPSTSAASAATGIDSASPSTTHRKRATPIRDPLLAPSSLPPVLVEVGKRDLFSAFESGWVLPEGSKRGGRSVQERPSPLPPPKKKQKTSVGSPVHGSSSPAPRPRSRLSTATPAMENRTLPSEIGEPGSPAESDLSSLSSVGEEDRQMDIDVPDRDVVKSEHQEGTDKTSTSGASEALGMSQPNTQKETVTLEPLVVAPNVNESPQRPIWIDVIESPATRRAENLRRRQEAKDNQKHESHTTKDIQASSEVSYEPGTLVWAKAKTFPWWPAQVIDESDDVPEFILEQKKENETRGGMWHIVQFYDSGNSWATVSRTHLALLGEDPEVDKTFLDRRRFKSANKRKECERYYEMARNSIETPSEQEDAETGDAPVPTVSGTEIIGAHATASGSLVLTEEEAAKYHPGHELLDVPAGPSLSTQSYEASADQQLGMIPEDTSNAMASPDEGHSRGQPNFLSLLPVEHQPV